MGFLKDMKEKYEESKNAQIFGQFMFIAMAISSIITAVTAYNLLKDAAVDVNGVINNWRTVPLTHVTGMRYNESCPAGWEDLPTTTNWPGADLGGCACRANALHTDDTPLNSSYSACNENQTEPLCYQDPSVPSISLSSWEGTKFCFRRTGEPAVIWDSGDYDPRPNPTDTETCPSGYHQCGTGTYDSTRAICYPTGVICPFTHAEEGSSASLNESIPYEDSSGFLNLDRETSDQLPLVNVKIAIDGGSRGVCYGQDKNLQNSYDGKAQWGSNFEISNQYPDSCGRVDTRFYLF